VDAWRRHVLLDEGIYRYSTYAIMGENLPILDFFVAPPLENATE
jgi:hypothetical protein